MKKVLALIFSLLIINLANAQNAIAKIKYEEAEEAYAKEDYQTAVTKLDEVEKILKSSNPKILYLKILSQYKLADTDFAIFQSLKKNCDTYLKKYENVENIEEKFREVYNISEALAKYPATQEGFNVLAHKHNEKKKKEQEVLNIQKAAALIAEKFNSWIPTLDGVKIGMMSSEIPAAAARYLDFNNPFAVKKGQYGADRDYTMYTPKYKSMSLKASEGLASISVDKATDQVVQVSKNNMAGGKSSTDYSKKLYDELVAKMKAHFGAENIVENETTKQMDKKSTYYSKIATLKENSFCQYNIIHTIIYYGGMFGTTVTVSESYSVIKVIQ